MPRRAAAKSCALHPDFGRARERLRSPVSQVSRLSTPRELVRGLWPKYKTPRWAPAPVIEQDLPLDRLAASQGNCRGDAMSVKSLVPRAWLSDGCFICTTLCERLSSRMAIPCSYVGRGPAPDAAPEPGAPAAPAAAAEGFASWSPTVELFVARTYERPLVRVSVRSNSPAETSHCLSQVARRLNQRPRRHFTPCSPVDDLHTCWRSRVASAG